MRMMLVRFSALCLCMGLSLVATGCTTVAGKPTMMVSAPPHGSQFKEGDNVVVQSTASDALGIARVELLVDGVLIHSAVPLTPNPISFAAAQNWKATPGTHTITVRAYNTAGAVSDPVAISVSVLPGAVPTIAAPLATAVPPPTLAPPTVACTDNAALVADVTVPPGTTFTPGQSFDKTWRVRNDGTCPWDARYAFVFVGGEAMTSNTTVAVPNTVPGATADFQVAMTAPAAAGAHAGQWQLRGAGGLFGATMSVSITVVSPTPTLPAGCAGYPNIDFFTASPSTISAGQSTTLMWGKVDNATSAVIDQGIGGVGTPGTRAVSPPTTTTYTMTATGCGGTTTKQVTVTVSGSAQPPPAPPPAPPPVPPAPTQLTFTFSPKSGAAGSYVNLYLSQSAPAASVYLGTALLVKQVSADGKTLTVLIPATASGSAYFELKWDGNSVKASEPFTVTPPPPPAQGDLILEDIFLSTNNDLIFRVAKTGSLTGSFKYQVITHTIVAQGSFAIPAGSQAFWTSYKPGGTVQVRVTIDPGNEIPETNENNNQMTKTCYPASHTCQ